MAKKNKVITFRPLMPEGHESIHFCIYFVVSWEISQPRKQLGKSSSTLRTWPNVCIQAFKNVQNCPQSVVFFCCSLSLPLPGALLSHVPLQSTKVECYSQASFITFFALCKICIRSRASITLRQSYSTELELKKLKKM